MDKFEFSCFQTTCDHSVNNQTTGANGHKYGSNDRR
jgi:hypothetical protein